MRTKTILLFVLSSMVLTMCRAYSTEPSEYANGLRCRNYTELGLPNQRQEGATCTYICPNGTEKETNVSGSVSPIYGASQAELNAELCGIPLVPTATATTPPTATATASPSPAPSPTEEASPTPTVAATVETSATVATPATAQASATPGTSGSTDSSILTGRVTMCDTGGNLISFRLAQPPPDLNGKTVTAEIAGQENACYVNAVNPTLLTCSLPVGVLFPATVAVSVDGTPSGEFTFNGLGCAKLSTPLPFPTP